MTGRLFMVVGASGAGKDTLLAGAVKADPTLYWARRVITRPEVSGGEPFEGVDRASFDARRAAGEFALDWQAHGLSYGVPKAELAPRDAGRKVLVNGSRAALEAALRRYPDLTVIRISAPSAVLAERLMTRGRESRADIEARLNRANYDLPKAVAVFDIINDASPETGIVRLLQAVSA